MEGQDYEPQPSLTSLRFTHPIYTTEDVCLSRRLCLRFATTLLSNNKTDLQPFSLTFTFPNIFACLQTYPGELLGVVLRYFWANDVPEFENLNLFESTDLFQQSKAVSILIPFCNS